MAQVFISYSHKDKEYAHKLAEELKRRGIEAWIDGRIDYGTEWPKVIQKELDECGGFIVIMSNNAYESKWVHNEVARADRKQKPFFPLLLQGETWLQMEATQYADVRNGELPPDKYFETIKKKIGIQSFQPLQATQDGKWARHRESVDVAPARYLDYGSLHGAIVKNILAAINKSSLAEWDIGLFKIFYSLPLKDVPKKYKWNQFYSLSSEILDTDLLNRCHPKVYLENKEDFNKFVYKPPVQMKNPSASDLIIPSMEMTRAKVVFRKRLNLELGMISETVFTKTDVEKFVGQLIDIHKAHHIPASEIIVKAIK